MTYEEWLASLRDDPERSFWNVQDPVAVHRRWGPFLEPGHFHVLTVPQPGAPSSLLWERFAGILGLDPEKAEAPESRQNESLGLVEAELLRRFNARLGARFPLRKPYVDVVRDHLMRPALFGAPGARRIGVPEEYVEWVTERSQQMVREVAELEGQVTVTGSADELAASITVAEESPADLDDSVLLEAALDAWVRQMEDVSDKLERTRERRAQGQQARAQAVQSEGESADDHAGPPTGLGRLRGRLRGGR